ARGGSGTCARPYARRRQRLRRAAAAPAPAARRPAVVTGAVAAPAQRLVGARVARKEDLPLLTGTARFVGDVERPGMVHAVFVRSPLAHARISALDVEAARAAPGVVDVVTAADLPEALAPIPIRMFSRPGLERFLQWPLARDIVRYSGDP